MKVIKGVSNLREKFTNPVLTMGIFDGVHLAHQKIIKAVLSQARLLKGTAIILTFNMHPLKVFRGHSAVPMITSLEDRINLIRQLGADVCIVLDFDKRFSRIPAQDFLKHTLIDTIGIKYLIVGQGFRFGRARRGSFALLERLSKIYGFRKRRINTLKIGGKTISSSNIRSLIRKGKIEEASRLLGRRFSIHGKVKRGSARGRLLGYPTANIAPPGELVPARGVYAVLVKLDNKIFPGILNIGTRPTFRAKKRSFQIIQIIEVHIFNFHKKIYNRNLKVFFIQRIRGEKKFASEQALLEQIKRDEFKAKGGLRAFKTADVDG